MHKLKKMQKYVAAALAAAMLCGEFTNPAPAQAALNIVEGILNKQDVKKILEDAASQMAEEKKQEANQAYLEYLDTYPSGAVADLQVIDRTVDSVTLYWNNSQVKSAQFFKVDYWMKSNPGRKQQVYVTMKTNNASGVVDSPTSFFELGGLEQGTYTVQITPGNYDESSTDGRRYEKDALGNLTNSFTTIAVAPAPKAPTKAEFRSVESGYCSVVVDGVNPYEGQGDHTYGVQVEVYDVEKSSKVCSLSVDNYQKATAAGQRNTKIKANAYYKTRARAYLLNEDGTKIYSSWSEYGCAASKMSSITTTQKNKKITVKWTKVKGATNYTVYISKSKDSGYKKVATTTKTSQVVAKYKDKSLKKDGMYYVKVVANLQMDGDVYKTSSTPKRVTIY